VSILSAFPVTGSERPASPTGPVRAESRVLHAPGKCPGKVAALAQCWASR